MSNIIKYFLTILDSKFKVQDKPKPNPNNIEPVKVISIGNRKSYNVEFNNMFYYFP